MGPVYHPLSNTELPRMFNSMFIVAVSLALLACVLDWECEAADRPGTNLDETKVVAYTLPDPLTCNDGTKVTDAQTWRLKRRPEILELFRANMQGRSPARPKDMEFEITSSDPKALNGLATRKEVAIHL